MAITKVKEISDKLAKYTYSNNQNDFIIVTEWSNLDGWTIQINDDKVISLSSGELDAINFLTHKLHYESD